MTAYDDIKKALETIGFDYEDVSHKGSPKGSPKGYPAYTIFRRDKEVFTVCLAVELQAASADDVMARLMSATEE